MGILGVRKSFKDENLKDEISVVSRRVSEAKNDISITKGHIQDITSRVLNIENTPNKKIISLSAGIEGDFNEFSLLKFTGGATEMPMIAQGQVLGMSLVCPRKRSEISVVMTLNYHTQHDYGINLDVNKQHHYRNFDTPLKFNAGDMITFLSKSGNANGFGTTATAIIELFL